MVRPGRSLTSMRIIRARDCASSTASKRIVKEEIGSRPVLCGAGLMEAGGTIMVVSGTLLPRAWMRNSLSAGQGTAGRNWMVRASSQRYSPGTGGATVRNSPGPSTGPPRLGPTGES